MCSTVQTKSLSVRKFVRLAIALVCFGILLPHFAQRCRQIQHFFENKFQSLLFCCIMNYSVQAIPCVHPFGLNLSRIVKSNFEMSGGLVPRESVGGTTYRLNVAAKQTNKDLSFLALFQSKNSATRHHVLLLTQLTRFSFVRIVSCQNDILTAMTITSDQSLRCRLQIHIIQCPIRCVDTPDAHVIGLCQKVCLRLQK